MKIFHTADLHIGMKFNNYPEPVRSQLKQARADVLGKIVSIANKQECNIFVVAGDLFDSINGNAKKTIGEVVTALKGFHGECVLVLPGNHDYDNNMVELWKNFQEISQDIHNIVFINQERPYSLADYDLNAVVYPAPCHSKHSDTNNIGWIKDANSDIYNDKFKEKDTDKNQIRIGIAHGALEGISPDLDSSYYNMSLAELTSAPVDVWLLGHTHITYPDKKKVTGWKVFNPGTPEPDGLDCKQTGNAWIITIGDIKALNSDTKALNTDTKALNHETKALNTDTKALNHETKALDSETKALDSETKALDYDTKALNSNTKASSGSHKEVSGELITTGSYRFKDQRHTVRNKADFEKIMGDLLMGDLLKDGPGNTIARLRIKGKLDEETFNYRHEVRRTLEEAMACLIFDDSEVGIKITSEMIHKEFSDGSFPSMLLSALTDDEEALQLAYEMIMGVRR